MSLPHGVALFAVMLLGLGAGIAVHATARAGEIEREARYTATRGETDRALLAAQDARRAEAHVEATRARILDLSARRNAARRARNMGLMLCLAGLFLGGAALFLVREGDDLDDFEIAQTDWILATVDGFPATDDGLDAVMPDHAVEEEVPDEVTRDEDVTGEEDERAPEGPQVS